MDAKKRDKKAQGKQDAKVGKQLAKAKGSKDGKKEGAPVLNRRQKQKVSDLIK
jgi:hypothetical protein